MRAALFFVAAMEILKLQLVASYLYLAFASPFPFPTAALVFAAGLCAGLLGRLRGGLLLYRALGHGAGLAVAFFALRWADGGGQGALRLAAVAAFAAAFWLRGAALGAKRLDHAACLARFDAGLGLFLCALSLSAIVRLENPATPRLVLPYLLTGIAALGFSKGASARRGGLARRSRGGLVASTTAGTILAAALLAALVPALYAPASQAGNALGAAFGAAEPYIGAFLRWLFRFQRPSGAAESAGAGDGGMAAPPLAESSPLAELIARIVLWTLGGVVGLLLLILAGYGLYALVRHLGRRVEGTGCGADLSFLPAWLRRLAAGARRFLDAAFGRLAAAAAARRVRLSPAAAAYRRLAAGARFAGAARLQAETPREYARRLSAAFPRAARDADFVVVELEKEAYGGIASDGKAAPRLRKAARRTNAAAFLIDRAARAIGLLR